MVNRFDLRLIIGMTENSEYYLRTFGKGRDAFVDKPAFADILDVLERIVHRGMNLVDLHREFSNVPANSRNFLDYQNSVIQLLRSRTSECICIDCIPYRL